MVLFSSVQSESGVAPGVCLLIGSSAMDKEDTLGVGVDVIVVLGALVHGLAWLSFLWVVLCGGMFG